VGQVPPTLEDALRRFGHEVFRPAQEAIVEAVRQGRDTLVVMPTGGGKSLCYQLPAVMAEGVALVISPLIALMKDQVDALNARGVPATFINSSLPPGEQAARIRQLADNAYKLVYIAPERFRHRAFLEHLRKVKLSFVAIDEAHCISQWGHDFRPDYLRVGEMLKELGHPPVSAFTATATPEVRADIERVLHLRNPAVFVTGFARPNLHFEIRQVSKRAEKFAALSRLLAEERTGIIYCATRKRVDEVASHLAEWQIPHIAYHGGMGDEERESLQDRFIRREVEVAVATNAFGMGIDRSDLRFVAHFEIPGSVEAFYQEAGRAGRDGLPARCVLLYNYADRRTQDFFIDGSNPTPDFVRSVYHQLLELRDEAHEIRCSIQDLTEKMGGRNSMQVGAALKLLGDIDLVERFDLPGERIRGTRLLQPDRLPFQVALDEATMVEKERRDRAKLDAVIAFATARTCRQQWMRSYFGEPHPEPCHRCDHCQRSKQTRHHPLDEAQTDILRKLLSGVARMSGRQGGDQWVPRFGRGLILQVLAGSSEKRVSDFQLDRLSTHGILRDLTLEFLRALFDAATDAGFLCTSGGSRPLVTLTPMGSAVMRGVLAPEMHWPKPALPPPNSRPPRGRSPSLALTSDSPDEVLLDALKKKRLQLAKARGNLPPYAILSNRALEGLARHRPRTPEEALHIPGIGPTKARTIVPAFLPLLTPKS
jgi:ATP-dependent DNA helicase RecQ